jgi:hypothetical protein
MKTSKFLLFIFYYFLIFQGGQVYASKYRPKINKVVQQYSQSNTLDPNKALDLIQPLLKFQKSCSREEQNIILLLLSQAEIRQGDIPSFINTISFLKKKNPVFKQAVLKFQYAQCLTKFSVYKNEAKIALNHNLIAVLGAKKSRINLRVAEAYQNRSFVFMTLNNKDSSVYYSQLASKYAKRTDSKIALAISFHNEALVLAHFNTLDLAVSKELLALQIAEKINDAYFQSIYNRAIAEYSLEVSNYKEASTYLLKSYRISERIKDERNMAICDLIKGGITLHVSEPEYAVTMLNNGIKKLKKLKQIDWIGQGEEYLGSAYAKAGNTSDALKSYNTALLNYTKLGNKDKLASIQEKIGIVYYTQSDLKQAEYYFNNSIENRIEQREQNKIYITYNWLSKLNSKKGKKEQAYNFLKKYVDFLELNTTSNDARKIEQMTMTSSREERERIIELQSETLEKQLKEKKILQLQSDRQLFGIIFIVVIVVLGIFIVIFRTRQNRALQEQQAAEMSQSLLRSQMNPHFIFNAMSVIQSYIYENTPERASKFLVNFSRLMRLILENSPKEFIPIAIEEEILNKYLTTQKSRFENRFNFVIHIEENLFFKRAMIPPMITQPFIENAIEHGQLHTVENGLITISFKENNNLLEISITDNGIGRLKAGKKKKNKTHNSMALNITNERIQILNKKYKSKGSLTIQDLNQENNSGTSILIYLPIIYETNNFIQDEKGTNN